MHAATKPLATPTLVSHRRLEQARPRVQAAIAALQAGDIVLVAEDARGPGAVFAIAAAFRFEVSARRRMLVPARVRRRR